MTTGQTRRRLAALTAVVIALATSVAACGKEKDGADAGALGFTRHAKSVDFPSVDDYVPLGTGLQTLVPLGNCALGIGKYRNGYHDVGVNWTGNASCTRLSLNPVPGTGGVPHEGPQQDNGWRGGGVYGDAAVPWPDGSLITVGASLARRTPDGKVHDLADLGLPTNNTPEHETADDSHVFAATRIGGRLLIGGGQYVNRVESPFVFLSDDGGATVRQVPLPAVGGFQPAEPVGSFGVNGDEVVAFGRAGDNAYTYTPNGSLAFWHSADAGAGWTAEMLTGMPPGTGVTAVVRSGGRWFAVGGYATGKLHTSLPLLLTSTDGSHWSRADTGAMGSGEIVGATLDSAGKPVLVGRLIRPSSAPGKRQTACGSVWVGDGSVTGWRRGELGCDEAPPTAVVTLKDGRVLIAGDRTLWIGDPAAARRGRATHTTG